MRSLPVDLREFFDGLNLVTDNCTPTDLLMRTAAACVGIKEEGGDNKGRMVELFQRVVGTPMRQSWCMDFMQACINYAECVKGVRSPLIATEGCLALWNACHVEYSVVAPEPGDLIIWQLGDGPHGHVGIVMGQDELHYETIEGNTSDSNVLDRNGDGVYRKMRLKGGSETFKEVGFLRVFPF